MRNKNSSHIPSFQDPRQAFQIQDQATLFISYRFSTESLPFSWIFAKFCALSLMNKILETSRSLSVALSDSREGTKKQKIRETNFLEAN